MIRIVVLAAALFVCAALPALANQCQDDIGRIDQALESSKLAADQKQEITDLREQAVQLCGAGNDSAGIDVAAQAKQILKID